MTQHVLQVTKLNNKKNSFLIVTSNKETPERGRNLLEFLLLNKGVRYAAQVQYMFK